VPGMCFLSARRISSDELDRLLVRDDDIKTIIDKIIINTNST